MARLSCAHCGLPVLAAPADDAGSVFCCFGCFLVSRIVGRRDDSVRSWTILRLGVGTFLSMDVMMISLLLYTGAMEPSAVPFFRWTLLGLSAPAMAILGYPFVQGAAGEFRRGRLSLDTLIATGSFAAFALSAANTIRGSGHVYYDTATMLPALVTLGKLIEATAKGRAARLAKSLETLLPASALRLDPAGPCEVALDQLRPGDMVRVRPGERFPADGQIIENRTTIEEAAFTGESRVRVCGPGDTVIAGTVSGEGSVVIRVEATGEQLLLRRIIEMVEQARQQPSQTQRLAEKAAAALVPAVLVFALAAGLFWLYADGARQAGFAMLAILAVTCPCAMGIAAPLATSLAIARAASAGVLVRGGDVLERIGQLGVMFFDKTGTVTLGMPAVQAVEVAEQATDANELLGILASLESASEHALGKAVVREARRRGLAMGAVRDVTVSPGQGIRGVVTWAGRERQVVAGTEAFVAASFVGATPPQSFQLAAEPRSHVCVAWDGAFRGRAVMGDSLRPDAGDTILALRKMGVSSVLLSGDTAACAKATAESLGIGCILAPRLPHEKIADLRTAAAGGKVTGMVGDGMNDAPALAAADVGIAMAAGTDLARQTGGVVLLSDQLLQIPWLIGLSRQTRRIIRQNLWWAVGYNAIALAAAAAGMLHPLLAAAAMVVSSLTVLGNSMRLQRFPAGAHPAQVPHENAGE